MSEFQIGDIVRVVASEDYEEFDLNGKQGKVMASNAHLVKVMIPDVHGDQLPNTPFEFYPRELVHVSGRQGDLFT